jgi:hypothetical protein
MLVLICLLVAVESALAKKEPKTYPEEGKVVGMGTKAYVGFGAPTVLFPSYRVETDTKVFELLCDHRKGCGGDKKLQIGDVIHFRLDQYRGTRCAFIVAPEANNPTREDKLIVLSEDLKPEAKPADKPSAAEPRQTDAKPPSK